MDNEVAQRWNPALYSTNARFVSDLGAPVLALLAPQPGERILDLGCGDGALTAKLAALGCDVVGVDSSPEMVAAARRLGLDARVADGASIGFHAEFDAVFSNAALHWMTNPDAVIAAVRRALKNGGRFVGEFGGHGNVAAIASALRRRGHRPPQPWFFPRPEEYAALLASGGFRVVSLESFPRPTPLPGHIIDWLRTFAGPFCALLPPAEREGFLAETAAGLQDKLRNADGVWHVDYVRLRFAATCADSAGLALPGRAP